MIRLGTRKSRLALVQTEIVKTRILEAFPNEEVKIVPIVTRGDRELDKALSSFGGKGVFTKEIEEQLLSGRIDIAVHSAKDIPLEFPAGLSLGAVLEREDPRDVLVTVRGRMTRELPPGSIVGTSSLRRELQIRRLNPGIQIQVLRGNVNTRLDKLRSGQYDAILLAAAGLKRLGLEKEADLSYEYLDTDEFVPAAGQGILALEIRTGSLTEVMKALNDKMVELCFKAEREVLKQIGGSCNAPCGVYCYKDKENFFIYGMYAGDGQSPSFSSESFSINKQKKGEASSKSESAVDLTQMAVYLEHMANRMAMRLKKCRVTLVGAGPGSWDLISRKGLECVKAADVIIYDNLISPSILNEARLDAELIYAGKRAHVHSMKQEEINQLLVEKACEGRYVVRLKGGDPFVFGRGGEEALALKQNGIAYEVVPGISSVYSAPAYVGIPVTHRGIASSFHVITGHEELGKADSAVDYCTLAQEQGTLVFLMGLGKLGEIISQLISNGKSPDTPAAVIQSATTARQQMVCGRLTELEEKVKKAGLSTPAVIVVGNVVSLSEELDWFQSLPLTGQRILLTGTRQLTERLEDLLEPLGAETVRISLIETVQCLSDQIREKLQNLSQYSWIVFTSCFGVQTFFEAMKEWKIDQRILAGVQFAAVGASTADMLEQYGYTCDFIPSRFQSKILAEKWIPLLSENDSVLLIRAKEGSAFLMEALQKSGIPVDLACIYETVTDYRRKEEVLSIVNDVDYLVITSGLAARALAVMLDGMALESTLAVIGPETRQVCEEAGLSVGLIAEHSSAEGIIEAIVWQQRREE